MSDPRNFLIVSWDGGGNTPHAFNLGTRLARRGHRVRLLGWESMADRSAAAGIEFTAYASMDPWPENLALDDAWDRVVTRLRGAAVEDDIANEAGALRADVLVLDCMMGAGFAAAAQLGLPVAVMVHTLYSAWASEWGDMVMQTSVRDLLAACGHVLALTPPGFDSPVELPANTSYLGPIMPPGSGAGQLRPADLEMITRPGDPWVLLSLSTTLQGQVEALPAMLAALESLPVRVMLTLGGVVPVDEVSAPSNVTVRAFIPHDAVLPYMAAVVCHGGMSTITSALAAGVPLVCIPQGRDQDMNAARVESCGVGRVVAPDSSPAEMASAIGDVLQDDAARSAALRFKAEITGLGGGAKATDEVERLASKIAAARGVSMAPA